MIIAHSLMMKKRQLSVPRQLWPAVKLHQLLTAQVTFPRSERSLSRCSVLPAVWTNAMRFEGRHTFTLSLMPRLENPACGFFSFLNPLPLDLGVHSPSCSIRKVGGPSLSLNKDPHVTTSGCDSWWSLWGFYNLGTTKGCSDTANTWKDAWWRSINMTPQWETGTEHWFDLLRLAVLY